MLVSIYEFCKNQQKRGGTFYASKWTYSYTSISTLYDILKKAMIQSLHYVTTYNISILLTKYTDYIFENSFSVPHIACVPVVSKRPGGVRVCYWVDNTA